MPIEKAKKLFLGTDCEKLNCYQAVLVAFQHKITVHEDDIKKGLKFSSGRAPNGLCGAVYAVQKILEMNDRADSFCHFSDYFSKEHGSLKCKEIRALKKISCIKCVEEAAIYLDKNLDKGI